MRAFKGNLATESSMPRAWWARRVIRLEATARVRKGSFSTSRGLIVESGELIVDSSKRRSGQ
jgi:hypothetical protein